MIVRMDGKGPFAIFVSVQQIAHVESCFIRGLKDIDSLSYYLIDNGFS